MLAARQTSILNARDYTLTSESRTIQSGSTEVCAQFGAVDDIIIPVIEDIEFYQISPNNIAQVLQELSVANMFNVYIFMSSCVGGSKAPLGTISAIYTRYAGTISTSYKNFR